MVVVDVDFGGVGSRHEQGSAVLGVFTRFRTWGVRASTWGSFGWVIRI